MRVASASGTCHRLALAAALLGLLAGCSGSEGSDQVAVATTSPATAPAATATTADPQAEQRAAVLAAYRAYWDDVVAAGRTADWRSPRLDDHATGEALAQTRATLRALARRGLVAKGTVSLRPKVLRLSGTTAVVYDCNSTSGFLAYDARTGQLRDRPSGQRNGKTVTLIREGGTWKVTKAETERGRCAR